MRKKDYLVTSMFAFIIIGNGKRGVKAMFLFIEELNYKLKKG